MSWDFAVDDLRKELKELKEKLAVQGVKIGEQESKLIKNEEDLKVAQDNYADTLYKASLLRKEADRALELEESLKRRNEELSNERNTRENVEQALRTANEEREKEAASVKETQYFLNQIASESSESRKERERLAAEKAKLDAQVRELQGELRRHEIAPPPPPKTPARPRASSLTHINKVVMLERDIEQIRASASSSEIDLKSTQEKLSKAQSDLIRIENEKAVLEKRLKDAEEKVKDARTDKSELQAELDFYREQCASGSREAELIARLEEEESKVTLLEQQLAQASRSSAMKRSIDQLQSQLDNEISRRQIAETREVMLVQEKEEALNELEDLKVSVREQDFFVQQRDTRIKELETRERLLREQLEITSANASSEHEGIAKITELENRIERIRAERDELTGHLEFVQLECRFKVEALEKALAERAANTPDDPRLQDHQSRIAQMAERVDTGKTHLQRLRIALSATLVTIQQLHSQSCIATSQEKAQTMEVDPSILCNDLDELLTDSSSLDSVVSSLQDNLRAKVEEAEHARVELVASLACKDDKIAELQLHLSDSSAVVRDEKERRTALEERVQELEVNLNTVRQELADALEHCERLEARQSSDASSNDTIRSLRKEVEELRSRVARRTEQIGLHQHDIKRLETNMRLMDERLEEVQGELEMAETTKAAMLEDCSTAREERDQAKKNLLQAELEVEQLAARVQGLEKETSKLQNDLAARDQRDQSVVSASIIERDARIADLAEKVKVSETALSDAQTQVAGLQKEIKEVQEAGKRSVEEQSKKMQDTELATSEELERRSSELQLLKQEVETSKLALCETEDALRATNEKYERATEEIEELKAELAAVKEAGEETSEAQIDVRMALDAKEKELERKEEQLRHLSYEFEALKTREEETSCMLESKQQELDICSAEVQRLSSELETTEAKQQEAATRLESAERQLAETSKQVEHLETEKADLLTRLAAFETESDKELTDSTALRSMLEEEREQYEQKVTKLEADIDSLRSAKEEQLRTSDSSTEEFKIRHQEITASLEETKAELAEQRVQYETLLEEHRKASACHEAEVVDLKHQLSSLSTEVENLQKSLQEEIDGRKHELAAHEEELCLAQDKQGAVADIESELKQDVQRYQDQLAEVRASLMSLQDENTTLQSEMDDLSGECHRAKLQSQSLERQLSSNNRELSELREELSHVREALSRSEKSGKTAEMNLLLFSQQNERTISSLRAQLKEHEKGAERIHKLQQIVGETREQISEMEGLLKAKCAEIEENDDKFIQLLKEKKKLTSKVESLTKKNNSLQNKLAAASSGPSKVTSPPPQEAHRQASALESGRPAPVLDLPSVHVERTTAAASSSSARPRLSKRPAPLESKTPEPSRRISGSKRRRESTPPIDELPVTTSIGKKRPLPDDSDSVRPMVEARFPDSYPSTSDSSSTPPMPSSSSTSALPSVPPTFEFTSTPRRRRTALHTGFTPVRGQAALRPTLSQPSPMRKTAAARAIQASSVISDVTNSPPRAKRHLTVDEDSNEPRVQKPAGKGWLGKIRGGANPLRSRQQPNTENRP
ncbi:uncharacterized protein FOMMEDRAFT_166919 [Fomitiporia mediterranea MF3/22]|uniref:uncharacterized protein n=1 Tax=Fomitiporia mediterranea (strain MF3/22) TaxID=694068 RepID=UPI0004408A6C|nr:uncharacterized protein FOMMEDRAFT_166919 [Fomitiporia mediterranea MF3/22]EJD03538.1 hypothetical protein FOMMEDRAFT_166919 [Fomitiporia mediterranea MF3/22]